MVGKEEIKYVKESLKKEESTPVWLSRKIGVSHTLVYGWFNGKRNMNTNHFIRCLNALKLPLPNTYLGNKFLDKLKT